tara:strand:- start:1271 stop:2494 length:1224 start_codon:yes stop_codon:yes gene_type:complete
MGFFSSIFKKVKKAITKPVSKIFKGIGKGIAKVAKNVWKGVKGLGTKAVQAYSKFSQKLGPIGMIGVSMAMPYLLGAFGATGGGLWTGFGKLAETGSLSTNPFLKVMGHVGKGMYNSANFVGGTAKGISQTISATFKGFANGSVSEGFKNLYQGAGEVLSGKAGMGTTKLGQYSMSQIGVPVYNPNTITQTGGVALGNVNVANSFYRDTVAAAMQKNTLFTGMQGDGLKYFNSVKKYYPGIDDKAAFEYIKLNGYTPETKLLDYSISPDFKFTAPMSEYSTGAASNYTFSGDNIKKTIDVNNINVNLGYTNKIANGEAFEMPGAEDGGILSKKNVKRAAVETAKNFFASDPGTQTALQIGSPANLNVVGSNYAGTNVTSSSGGSLLAQINPELAKQIQESQLNIVRG